MDKLFEVGVPEIDAQHHDLEHLVDELRKVLGDAEKQELVRPALKRLSQMLINHFDYEESLMQMVAYPDLVHHKRMHNGVLKLFRDTLENPPGPDDCEHLSKLIGDKVLGHIMEHDIPLAASIRKYLAENAVRAP
jgi:hemerythrin